MSENQAAGLALGARVIPWPTTISEQARQVLANPSLALPTRLPPPGDKAGWKALVSQIAMTPWSP